MFCDGMEECARDTSKFHMDLGLFLLLPWLNVPVEAVLQSQLIKRSYISISLWTCDDAHDWQPQGRRRVLFPSEAVPWLLQKHKMGSSLKYDEAKITIFTFVTALDTPKHPRAQFNLNCVRGTASPFAIDFKDRQMFRGEGRPSLPSCKV